MRAEKTLARKFMDRSTPFFLPLYQREWRNRGRLFRSHLPLFPGYLFCRLDLNTRLLPLFTTPGVVRLLGVGQTPLPVDDCEIDAIRAVLKTSRATRPWPMPKAGERVRIEAGPLCGVEGILVGQKRNSRLVVSVTLLQRAIAVEVDADTARPVQSIRPVSVRSMSGNSANA